MSLIARHKKPGAFEKLVNSLETTSKSKREKLINVMSQEDPVFMDRVVRSILTFEDLKNIPDPILMEITHRIDNMQWFATALYKVDDKDLVEKFLKCLTTGQMGEYRTYAEMLDKVTVGQRESSQLKLVTIARQVEAEKGLKIKPYATE